MGAFLGRATLWTGRAGSWCHTSCATYAGPVRRVRVL